MCTVMLRFTPNAGWPLVLAAVRDEFVDRAWDPPAEHWPDVAPGIVGGRDRAAGGTWLAVRRRSPAVAALLNGVRLPPPTDRVRPSRGGLPLAVLSGATPTTMDLAGYDGFHLVLGTPSAVTVWSWDGVELRITDLAPGNHIIVNDGVDTVNDPLVPYFTPLLESVPPLPSTASLPSPSSSAAAAVSAPAPASSPAWRSWRDLLRGDGLAGDDPRALLVSMERDGRTYGSTSAALIALSPDVLDFTFTATPDTPDWHPVPLPPPPPPLPSSI